MRSRTPALGALLVMLAAACSAQPPVPSAQVEPQAVAVPVEERVGTLASGARFEVYRPANWNGQLVVYAHGYVDPELEVAPGLRLKNAPAGMQPLPSDAGGLYQELRDTLLSRGFGFAWSARSRPGYAVAEGIRDHGGLKAEFASAFEAPTNTFLMGDSLGGLIVLAIAEGEGLLGRARKTEYAGALSACGPVNGSQYQIDYLSQLRVLFDAQFPGVLEGSLLDPRPDQSLAVALGGLFGNPNPLKAQQIAMQAATLAAIDQVGLAYDPQDPSTLAQSLGEALAYTTRGGQDLLERAGGNPFDNRNMTYTILGGPHPLNAVVERYKALPQARKYLRENYEPRGNPRIPVVTLHTTLDPQVPFRHQASYAARSDSPNLVQFSVERYGHCNMNAAERLLAFQALVGWALAGQKPSGGDITMNEPVLAGLGTR